MAFVKLDTGILNSTLWVERECREVFLTALLMALPREFTEPQAQIEVRSLLLTGFVAPPGWYGFIEAAGVGIVRRAMVDQAVGMEALEKLGSEDPESRSKEYGGRRLIRVNGGYLVLNFIKYRDKDHTAAERARRYRDKKANASRCDISTSHRDITQAEAYTEAEAEKKNTARKRASPSAPVVRLPSVSQEVWDAWLALRKQKKAPVTQTVVNTALREAEKAGMTPEAFFALWCYRGSVGLMADWLKPEERRQASEPEFIRARREQIRALSGGLASVKPHKGDILDGHVTTLG